jgi:hypothetical protein
MHIVKKVTTGILFYFLGMVPVSKAWASIGAKPVADTIASLQRDTGKIKAYRIINRNFNDIYNQNLRLSSAGQEFFDPMKTLLVADLTANFILLSSPKLPFYFVGSARINLRLLSGFGSPVEAPSYMPGGTFYFRTNKDFYHPQFFSVAYSHHSNGLRGPTTNPDGSFNTDSGKFTTNFYTIMYHTGKRTDKADVIINRYDAFGLELHSALVGLGYSHALKGKYGFVRVNGQWIYNLQHANTDPIDNNRKEFQNWQRLQLDFQYIADKYDDYNTADIKKRLNVALKYYYQFPFMQNVALMAGAGYRGQDEYNILFQNSYPYLTAGIAAGLSFGFHKN